VIGSVFVDDGARPHIHVAYVHFDLDSRRQSLTLPIPLLFVEPSIIVLTRRGDPEASHRRKCNLCAMFDKTYHSYK
jgi:hypothetical protein